MKVLVTGSAGFIGSHVAKRLLQRGDTVVGVDNFDPFYDRSFKEKNIAEMRLDMELIEGDITDRRLLDLVLTGEHFDGVVHLAALAGVRPSIARPWAYQHVNVVGTSCVAEAMVAHEVPRMVFASSSSVYGNNVEVPYEETQRVDHPASPYAASKRSCELLLDTFCQLFPLNACCLRYFTVYGPRQRPEMAIHKFGRAILDGETVPLYGDGQTSRDYTYVDDIVDGTIAALDKAPAGFTIYNLGGRSPVRLDKLIAAIGRAVGKEPRIRREPLQPGDVQQTWASTEAARRDLGFQARVPLAEGLSRFAAWLRGEVPW
jgi:UDP-glucuronate 4-epimerase